MKISAVLLAGGKSRRMGEDKATIVFRNRPLWQIQIELLRKVSSKEIFISAPSDPPWRPADIEFVPDDQPSRGPLSGIAAALSDPDAADHEKHCVDFTAVAAIGHPQRHAKTVLWHPDLGLQRIHHGRDDLGLRSRLRAVRISFLVTGISVLRSIPRRERVHRRQ